MVTSEYSVGRIPLVFSMVSETSAIPMGFRFFVPLKITSSILSLRNVLGRCSPSAQRIASTTFVFPQPLGPTMAVIPASNFKLTLFANDLNPTTSNFDKYMIPSIRSVRCWNNRADHETNVRCGGMRIIEIPVGHNTYDSKCGDPHCINLDRRNIVDD